MAARLNTPVLLCVLLLFAQEATPASLLGYDSPADSTNSFQVAGATTNYARSGATGRGVPGGVDVSLTDVTGETRSLTETTSVAEIAATSDTWHAFFGQSGADDFETDSDPYRSIPEYRFGYAPVRPATSTRSPEILAGGSSNRGAANLFGFVAGGSATGMTVNPLSQERGFWTRGGPAYDNSSVKLEAGPSIVPQRATSSRPSTSPRRTSSKPESVRALSDRETYDLYLQLGLLAAGLLLVVVVISRAILSGSND